MSEDTAVLRDHVQELFDDMRSKLESLDDIVRDETSDAINLGTQLFSEVAAGDISPQEFEDSMDDLKIGKLLRLVNHGWNEHRAAVEQAWKTITVLGKFAAGAIAA